MSMFPHTVTLYNVERATDPATLIDTEIRHVTVLEGVLLDAVKSSNVRRSGLESADAAMLYIPRSVRARHGESGAEKAFVGAMEFWAAEDKSGLWTLSDGGDTYFAAGVVVRPDATREQLELQHDGVYTVTKVDDKDFGGLPHWEVGGK